MSKKRDFILSEELEKFLLDNHLTLVDKENPKRGGYNIVYFAKKQIPGSTDEPSDWVVKIPIQNNDIESVIHNTSILNNNSLSLGADIYSDIINDKRVPSTKLLKYNHSGKTLNIITQPKIEGISLEKLVNTPKFLNSPNKEEVVKQIFYQYSDLLSIFESRGIKHNDITPSNLMINYSEDFENIQVYTHDLNLAKHKSGNEVFKGSDFFSSPEKIGGLETTSKSDQFSLGLCMYYLLNGNIHVDLKQKDKCRDKSRKILLSQNEFESSLDYSNITSSFKKIIKKTLAYNPEQRYSNFSNLKSDLDKILIETKRQKRKKIITWTTAVLTSIVMGATGLVYNSWQNYKSKNELHSSFIFEEFKPLFQALVEPVSPNGLSPLDKFKLNPMWVNTKSADGSISEVYSKNINETNSNYLVIYKSEKINNFMFRYDFKFDNCTFIKLLDGRLMNDLNVLHFESEQVGDDLKLKNLKITTPFSTKDYFIYQSNFNEDNKTITITPYKLNLSFDKIIGNPLNQSNPSEIERLVNELGISAPLNKNLTFLEYVKYNSKEKMLDLIKTHNLEALYNLTPVKLETLPKDYNITWTQYGSLENYDETEDTINKFGKMILLDYNKIKEKKDTMNFDFESIDGKIVMEIKNKDKVVFKKEWFLHDGAIGTKYCFEKACPEIDYFFYFKNLKNLPKFNNKYSIISDWYIHTFKLDDPNSIRVNKIQGEIK